jgi:hypothetical protein
MDPSPAGHACGPALPPLITVPSIAPTHEAGLATPYAESGERPVGHPPLLSCPSWARTRTLLIPYHFGFRRRSASVRGLDCAFTFAPTRSGSSHPVSTPSPFGAWLGVTGQGFADFESIHSRRFRRGVQRAHRQVPLESGVLPVTPRGSVPCLRPLASQRGRGSFYPEPRARSIHTRVGRRGSESSPFAANKRIEHSEWRARLTPTVITELRSRALPTAALGAPVVTTWLELARLAGGD